ncbi:MAG: RNA polymerase sigma-54 factor [Micavibrio aeruginosavorus]|uniref:RNA polymerase sigma-54 factor n=1 Tax=Micavibrio aeruginosavorus TaxID=349221 RepID=A0A2W5HRZ2_9BACT|nr:MAG: RNA polymerase sigma-54 factor [Micavibrio aeruginosavorus]
MAGNKLSQTLDLRQQQNLVMTPQMQQAIKLLQLSNVELQDYLDEEIAQNPLLEKIETERSDDDDHRPEEKPEREDDPENDFDAGSSMSNATPGGRADFSEDERTLESTHAKEKNLHDHLMEQLTISAQDALDKTIGTLLIDRLDEAGYLRESPEELAAQLGVSEERITKLVARLKKFDPAGIFAFNLSECLMLQLEDRGVLDAPMKILLENLNLLGQHDYAGLAKICDVHPNVVKEMAQELRTLQPKPASLFDHSIAQTAIPDVLMRKLPKDKGGGWRVELNSDTLPRVLVNQQYYTDVTGRTKDKGEREYLVTQLNNANWLAKALDQRAQTILKVASEIVERQDAFFLFGIEYLAPLTLREVADSIGMHESTVSRVTTGKFIGTPRGLFELKFFFTSSIEGSDGGSVSSEAVKSKIKTLIDAEEPKAILSDDDIVDLLQKDGIDIARRTIAKYREAMGIPSSVQRRRIKKI